MTFFSQSSFGPGTAEPHVYYFKIDTASAGSDAVPPRLCFLILCSAAACCDPVSVPASVPVSAILSPHARRGLRIAVKALLYSARHSVPNVVRHAVLCNAGWLVKCRMHSKYCTQNCFYGSDIVLEQQCLPLMQLFNYCLLTQHFLS